MSCTCTSSSTSNTYSLLMISHGFYVISQSLNIEIDTTSIAIANTLMRGYVIVTVWMTVRCHWGRRWHGKSRIRMIIVISIVYGVSFGLRVIYQPPTTTATLLLVLMLILCLRTVAIVRVTSTRVFMSVMSVGVLNMLIMLCLLGGSWHRSATIMIISNIAINYNVAAVVASMMIETVVMT